MGGWAQGFEAPPNFGTIPERPIRRGSVKRRGRALAGEGDGEGRAGFSEAEEGLGGLGSEGAGDERANRREGGPGRHGSRAGSSRGLRQQDWVSTANAGPGGGTGWRKREKRRREGRPGLGAAGSEGGSQHGGAADALGQQGSESEPAVLWKAPTYDPESAIKGGYEAEAPAQAAGQGQGQVGQQQGAGQAGPYGDGPFAHGRTQWQQHRLKVRGWDMA